MYLIDYIAYGLQFPHGFWNSPKSAQTPKCVIVTPEQSPSPPYPAKPSPSNSPPGPGG